MLKEKKNLARRIFLILVIVFLVLGSYTVGFLVGRAELRFEKGYIPKVINKEPTKPISDIDFGIFWRVWDLVDEKFPGPIDHQKMLFGAISGMLKALDDPYTVYFTPDQAQDFMEEMSGSFEGIGAEIGKKDDELTIISVFEQTPAQRAGLKSGDAILKIDDAETSDMTVEEAVMKIRGPKGTMVKLEINREGFLAPREFKITRDKITIDSVSYKIREDFAYIRVRTISEVSDSRIRGVILDLRNNPGGYLDSAVDIASEFIKEGEIIVYEEFRDGKKKGYRSSGGKLTDLPLVVLVDNGSASASEIIAGAIQDYNRGILIGEKTFGKGSVQSLEELPLGLLKITTAYWLTPKGHSISDNGLSPDIGINIEDEDYYTPQDLHIKKALEYLKERGQ